MDNSISCLEDCLIALGSKKPFLKEQKIIDKFDEDLLDEIANGFGCF